METLRYINPSLCLDSYLEPALKHSILFASEVTDSIYQFACSSPWPPTHYGDSRVLVRVPACCFSGLLHIVVGGLTRMKRASWDFETYYFYHVSLCANEFQAPWNVPWKQNKQKKFYPSFLYFDASMSSDCTLRLPIISTWHLTQALWCCYFLSFTHEEMNPIYLKYYLVTKEEFWS